jgi:hypothetical protein
VPHHWDRDPLPAGFPERLQGDQSVFAGLLEQYLSDPHGTLEILVGREGPAMIPRATRTPAYLQHPDVNIRLAALLVAVTQGPLFGVDLLLPVLEAMLLTDPDPRARGGALAVLAAYPNNMANAEIRQIVLGWRRLCASGGNGAGEIAGVAASAEGTQVSEWKSLAGDHVEVMLSSRPAAEHSLLDPAPQRRTAALSILANYWGPTPELRDTCRRLLLHDPDPNVRRFALAAFALCCYGTNDPEAGKLLAGIVNDESAPEDFRLQAYAGLFHLSDPREPAQRQIDPTPYLCQEIADINRTFVDRFL